MSSKTNCSKCPYDQANKGISISSMAWDCPDQEECSQIRHGKHLTQKDLSIPTPKIYHISFKGGL